MAYAHALFCQYLEAELKRGSSPRQGVRRAVEKLSPTSDARTLGIYTQSLLDTVTCNGALRPDWQDCVRKEH